MSGHYDHVVGLDPNREVRHTLRVSRVLILHHKLVAVHRTPYTPYLRPTIIALPTQPRSSHTLTTTRFPPQVRVHALRLLESKAEMRWLQISQRASLLSAGLQDRDAKVAAAATKLAAQWLRKQGKDANALLKALDVASYEEPAALTLRALLDADTALVGEGGFHRFDGGVQRGRVRGRGRRGCHDVVRARREEPQQHSTIHAPRRELGDAAPAGLGPDEDARRRRQPRPEVGVPALHDRRRQRAGEVARARIVAL